MFSLSKAIEICVENNRSNHSLALDQSESLKATNSGINNML